VNKRLQALLTGTENRESFFKRIAFYYPTMDHRYKEIEKAYNYAKDGFRDKKRDGGERYFEHIRAVALILIEYLRVRDHRLIIAALLHDIVEDVPSWTVERVRIEFGDYVALLVEFLTKPSSKEFSSKKERTLVYHLRFETAPRDFFLIKLADRLHNVTTLWSCTAEKRVRKIAETREEYLPYAEKHFILYYELLDALEELEKAA